MKALVVEDEPVAVRSLQRLLASCAPHIDASAHVGSVRAAIEWLGRNPQPDVIFLDVQLSDGLSFEIFETIRVDAPVVFVTAHDEFALRAFEVFGIDYLLKPVSRERLEQALAKLRQVAPPVRDGALTGHYRAAARQFRKRFLVQSGANLVSVDAGDVAYFVKELVVRLVTRDGRGYPMSQPLDEIQQALDPERFFRVNRQVIARMDAIARVHRLPKGRIEVTLSPGTPEAVIVSQERAAAFRAWLGR